MVCTGVAVELRLIASWSHVITVLYFVLYAIDRKNEEILQVGTFKTENHVGLAVESVPGKHPFMIFWID